MGRDPSGWYHRTRKGYFVELGGEQIPLLVPCAKSAENKAAAKKALRAILDEREKIVRAGITLVGLSDLFMSSVKRERAPLTTQFYLRHLKPFVEMTGRNVAASDVRPFHVSQWLATRSWGATTRHGAVTAVKRLFAWAKSEGHLAEDRLADMDKPTPRRREAILTAPQVAAILAATPDRRFRDLLRMIRETGARPGEIAGLTADRVDLAAGVVLVSNKTRHATGEQTRTVYLNEVAAGIVRDAVAEHPEGILFRNRLGNPWTRNAMACRFADLKPILAERGVTLGEEGAAYSLRHLFITDALEKGIPPATVAELVGHQDLTMIMRIYNKLKHRTEHLRAAAEQIRPAPG